MQVVTAGGASGSVWDSDIEGLLSVVLLCCKVLLSFLNPGASLCYDLCWRWILVVCSCYVVSLVSMSRGIPSAAVFELLKH